MQADYGEFEGFPLNVDLWPAEFDLRPHGEFQNGEFGKAAVHVFSA